MKRMRLPDTQIKLGVSFRPKLFVREYVSTKKGDPERGPLIRMNAGEAKIRLVQDGELVWVVGPRRTDLAELHIDNSLAEGDVFLRDIAGVTHSEYVTVTRPDTDSPLAGRHFG